MLPNSLLAPILKCPLCQSTVCLKEDNLNCINQDCFHYRISYPAIEGIPVLVDFENSLIDYASLTRRKGDSPIPRRSNSFWLTRLLKYILNPYRGISIRNLEECRLYLSAMNQPKVLIVGGGTLGFGCPEFLSRFDGMTISFDVYYSTHIDLIADANAIPFKDETFDLVIIQAVLEHVLNPYTVARECERVLKVGGYIYSEIPFLQHVHEGAYDFTRFTPLGHRMLFKRFAIIKSGSIGGSGLSLLWSIENYIAGIFRSRMCGKIAKLLILWIVLVEKMIPNEWNNDGACASYFLGIKMQDRVEVKTYLKDYAGAQR